MDQHRSQVKCNARTVIDNNKNHKIFYEKREKYKNPQETLLRHKHSQIYNAQQSVLKSLK